MAVPPRQKSDVLADLPDDVRDMIAPHIAEDEDTLTAISLAIAAKRDEAKTARTTCGMETTWKEAEEAYIGIDDANRGEFQGARWAKPMSIEGPVTTGRMPVATDNRSTAFVRLTARYVDAGAAKVGEILLPPDDKAFSFSEMPVPELILAKEDMSQVVHNGVPLTRPAPSPPAAGVPPQPTAPVAAHGQPPIQPASQAAGQPTAPQVPVTVKDFAEENIEIARKKAKAAEQRIYDWMVACQYQAEMRKVIFDAARIGVGVLKAPYPKPSRGMAVTKAKDGGIQVTIKEDISPAAAWVDPWNIFPDPTCGENIHDGDYVFERDHMSARQVRQLKQIKGYINAQIDKVLEEGPDKIDTSDDMAKVGAPGELRVKGRYTIWYYYGSLKKDEINALNAAAGLPAENDDAEQVYAIVTMINDRVVRASINPLNSGSFPYHSVPWQRRAGHWAGIGVAEQLKMPQRTVNAATRAMLNNAGKSAGSQIIVDRTGIIPADQEWQIVPDKIWFKTGDAVGTDVRQLFMSIDIPNITPQLMTIIQYGMQLAEELTSIPLVTQGQSGETTPETYGATQLQDTNANQLLRSIGYSFDDHITEPAVRGFYEWLLLDPDVPDDEKGDFRINAHGSIALVERAIQDQVIGQVLQLSVANPVLGMDPKKTAKLFLRSKRLDPEDVQYTDEQQAKIDAAPPPEPPPVTVAKIVADTAMKQLAAKQTADQQSTQSEERIAAAANVLEGGHVQNEQQRIAAEQHKTLADATVKLHELSMKRELAMLEYANRHQISLDSVKAKLASTAMTLQTQRALNAEDNAADMRRNRPERPRRGAPPPGQTPGRAGDGRGFEQGPPPPS